MPTVSVSIRNEDYDKWRELKSPAEFIHNALKDDKPTADTKSQPASEAFKDASINQGMEGIKTLVHESNAIIGRIIKTPEDAVKALSERDYKPIPKSLSARKKK